MTIHAVHFAQTITLEEYRRRQACGEPIPCGEHQQYRPRHGMESSRVETRIMQVERCGGID